MNKERPFTAPTGKKKFKATLLSQPKPIDLMERTYGKAIRATEESEKQKPPANPSESGSQSV